MSAREDMAEREELLCQPATYGFDATGGTYYRPVRFVELAEAQP